jgi:energy-coupling factor transporter ATP-binding protein EcfA2
VKGKVNILVSGGTGSGKTTLLNILSGFIPENEQIITIEDSAELQLQQDHVCRMETRPPNIEGKGEVAQRDLVRNSLRIRPDRIVVGEVRGVEVMDMLQAMNTGHEGSMTTIHANSVRDALILIVTLREWTGWRATLDKLAKELMRTGIYKTPGNFPSLAVILASADFILGRFVDNFLVCLLIALVAGTIPFLFLSIKKKQRTGLIERQMPDVMELLARSLRAGHTLPSAMELAGKETPDPLGTELRTP